MTTGVTWGQCISHYAKNVVLTPVSYVAAKKSGLSEYLNVNNLVAFFENEGSIKHNVFSIPSKIWTGVTTSIKVDALSIRSFEKVEGFISKNYVSLGAGAAWGFAHSAVDHFASRFFGNFLYFRSTVTYALTGVMIWGAAQVMDLDLPAETLGNIALSAYAFSALGKAAYLASTSFYAIKEALWWNGAYPSAKETRKAASPKNAAKSPNAESSAESEMSEEVKKTQ